MTTAKCPKCGFQVGAFPNGQVRQHKSFQTICGVTLRAWCEPAVLRQSAPQADAQRHTWRS